MILLTIKSLRLLEHRRLQLLLLLPLFFYTHSRRPTAIVWLSWIVVILLLDKDFLYGVKFLIEFVDLVHKIVTSPLLVLHDQFHRPMFLQFLPLPI